MKTTVVARHQFVVAELTKHNGFLLRQNACMQQLREHALDPVRVLSHVFNEQNTAFDGRAVGCADQ